MIPTTNRAKEEPAWSEGTVPVIGKDVLELLSSAMYVDPLTIFREYVQNAADSIEKAKISGLLDADDGKITIKFDWQRRSIRIRDNGTGITRAEFVETLTTIGQSKKRGTGARGFRGVGRLAGLGYCQELYFRSRCDGEAGVSEMLWDGRSIRTALRNDLDEQSLQDLVAAVVSNRQIRADSYPEHFFEVEMVGVVRLGNDSLMNAQRVYDYLSEIAPVPFHPEFSFGEQITSELSNSLTVTSLAIEITGMAEQVFRPHRDVLVNRGQDYDRFREVEIVTLPSVDETAAGIAWFAHHGYKGALSDNRLRGLRLRSGNLQVGTNYLLQDLFGETRFNSWAVGEVHVIDSRLVPNGRRDHYEMNVHFDNLANQLTPFARQIGARCRHSSQLRNLRRTFEVQLALVRDKMSAVKQGSLSLNEQRRLIIESDQIVLQLSQKLLSDLIDVGLKLEMGRAVKAVMKKLDAIRGTHFEATALGTFSKGEKEAIELVFSLIYECSTDHARAERLIDDILLRLA